MTKKVFYWEFYGLIGVVILWAILHYSYKFTGLSLFSAVNGSIWEHVKIAFFSLFTLYIVESFYIAKYCKNFWYGKMVGLMVLIVTTLILFYIFNNIGLSIIITDVIAGIIGFLFAQLLSYRILISEVNHSKYQRVYISMIIILMVPFFVFTYYPIKNDLFKDLTTNAYGIFDK
ncbi:MAG: DUF6512 family protein [Vallitalea sp.]|jgi:hypothetical protein|nr:DUF6512 family protein [Vallitalea sp.]